MQTTRLYILQNRSYCRSKFGIAEIFYLFVPVTLTLTFIYKPDLYTECKKINFVCQVFRKLYHSLWMCASSYTWSLPVMWRCRNRDLQPFFAPVTLTWWPSHTNFKHIPWGYTSYANMNFLCQNFRKLVSDRQKYRHDQNDIPHCFVGGQEQTDTGDAALENDPLSCHEASKVCQPTNGNQILHRYKLIWSLLSARLNTSSAFNAIAAAPSLGTASLLDDWQSDIHLHYTQFISINRMHQHTHSITTCTVSLNTIPVTTVSQTFNSSSRWYFYKTMLLCFRINITLSYLWCQLLLILPITDMRLWSAADHEPYCWLASFNHIGNLPLLCDAEEDAVKLLESIATTPFTNKIIC